LVQIKKNCCRLKIYLNAFTVGALLEVRWWELIAIPRVAISGFGVVSQRGEKGRCIEMGGMGDIDGKGRMETKGRVGLLPLQKFLRET